MLQAAEARSKQHASRVLADELKQYQRELHEQQIAKRNQQKALRERLQAQVHETQRQRDAATAEVCIMIYLIQSCSPAGLPVALLVCSLLRWTLSQDATPKRLT